MIKCGVPVSCSNSFFPGFLEPEQLLLFKDEIQLLKEFALNFEQKRTTHLRCVILDSL